MSWRSITQERCLCRRLQQKARLVITRIISWALLYGLGTGIPRQDYMYNERAGAKKQRSLFGERLSACVWAQAHTHQSSMVCMFL